jgi:hypothetical protein
VLVGLAGVLVLAGAAIAREWRSGRSSRTLTPSEITREFAARGVALETDPSGGLEPGSPAHLIGSVLWNRNQAAKQGVITVSVVRSTAEAVGIERRFHAAFPVGARSSCGSASYLLLWRARNAIAMLSSCDFLGQPPREATAPMRATVAALMAALA